MQPLWLYLFLLFFLWGWRVGAVDVPPGLGRGKPVDCAICSVRRSLSGVASGHGGRGCELFADVSQNMEISLLIFGWQALAPQGQDKTSGKRPNGKQQGGQDVRPHP